jgi:signal transduction histidine kinase
MLRARESGKWSWTLPVLLIVLCLSLGALQYRWIDEASRAERDRLRAGLQDSLTRMAIALNADVTSSVSAFFPSGRPPDGAFQPDQFRELYGQWREATHHDRLFAAIGLVTLSGRRLQLFLVDPASGEVRPSDWPPRWQGLRGRMEGRLAQMLGLPPEKNRQEFRPGPPPPEEALLFEVARFGRSAAEPRPNLSWLVFELDEPYLRDVLIAEHLRRYLGQSAPDFQIEISYRSDPGRVFYRNGPQPLAGKPDAETALLELQYDRLFRRLGPQGMREPPRARIAGAEFGRLFVRVRHRAGSLDAVVARTRRLNLAVTFSVLVLMGAAVAAIVLSTRRAQRLAGLQMDFVAGVSHELRTPLTVIRTAAYNLRGKLAANPAMVEKYGALIQKESERLTEIVEQVLEFARFRSAASAVPLESVSIREAADQALAACQPLIESSGVRVEDAIPSGLPPVLADRRALAHCLQNLISNAVKYGGKGGWLGLSAAARGGFVEVCVADRGPGIPPGELKHVFEPFFRGRRAIDDQIHGTGLGLSLVKSAVESFGGAVEARSTPGRETEFLLRIPAAPHLSEAAQPATAGGTPA